MTGHYSAVSGKLTGVYCVALAGSDITLALPWQLPDYLQHPTGNFTKSRSQLIVESCCSQVDKRSNLVSTGKNVLVMFDVADVAAVALGVLLFATVSECCTVVDVYNVPAGCECNEC